jgi:hypothetical protein
MGLVYTTISHKFRKFHKLTCNEYVFADMIYKLSTSPLSKIKGWCYMSRPIMADEMGLSKQSILNLIDILIDKGFIERDEKTAYLRTTRAWNIVYFSDLGGKESLPLKGKESLPDGGKESLPNINTLDNYSLFDNKESVCFNDFWNLYSKKVGKKPCEILFKKLKLDVRKQIISILPAWKKQFKNLQFLPDPLTFLKNERWNDEIINNQNNASKYPMEWSQQFQDTLSGQDLSNYYKWLHENGFSPDKNRFDITIGWSKKKQA